MEVLSVLIPIALILLAAMLGLFLWSIRSGQFDDLEGPAHRILMDDDEPRPPRGAKSPDGDVAVKDKHSGERDTAD